jgi:hypothetical protein
MNIVFDSNFGKPVLGISNAAGGDASQNYVVLYGAAAGESPTLMAFGEANVGLDLQTKGTGQFTVNGEPVGGGGSDYTLPISTATVLGGVKVGAGLAVTADGTLSAAVAGNYLLKTGDVMNGALRFASTGVSSYNSTDVYMFWDGTYFRCVMPGGGKQGWLVDTAGKVQFPSAVPLCNQAPTATGDLTNKAYVDAQISGSTVFLKTTGGTMTGTITAPTTVPALTFGTSGYNVFGASGGVAVRSNNTNIANFTASEVVATVPITTAGTGVGVRFGSGGPSLSKSGTSIASSAPITVAAAPATATELANKKYVDDAIAAAIAALP